jgi:hypothetical protein
VNSPYIYLKKQMQVVVMKQKSVYILFTDTGTLFSKMIRLYTKKPLNHASIALNAELTELYSFGRKQPNNPFRAGFVKETLYGNLIRNGRKTLCALYRCDVPLPVYKRILKTIREMEQNQDDYQYNLIGLLGVMLNRSLGSDKSYFCSQFVADLFQKSGLPLTAKPAALSKPADLERSPHLQPVFRGDLRVYAAAAVRRSVAKPVSLRRIPRAANAARRSIAGETNWRQTAGQPRVPIDAAMS